MNRLILQLDWKPNAQFAGILLAHHLGWYRQAGFELIIRPGQIYQNPVDALQGPENIIVSADDNLIIEAQVAGRGIKAISSMLQFSAFGWMALEGSGITTMGDFKGKRVGVHSDGEIPLDIALAHFDLSRTDLEVVNFGYDYIDVLSSGQCDVIQGFIITEPLEFEQRGLAVRVLPAHAWGYEAYSQVLATTEPLLATHSDRVVRFLKITYDGWRRALQTPQETCRLIAHHYLPETAPELEAKILAGIEPFLVGNAGLERLGWMNKERWQRRIDYLFDYRLISRRLPAEEVMTNHLMESAYALQ
jgi:ABC-type nitrate/sulfonate/bicarbonate transport system substrate-binding protein